MQGLNHRGRPGGQREGTWPEEPSASNGSQDQEWKTYNDQDPEENVDYNTKGDEWPAQNDNTNENPTGDDKSTSAIEVPKQENDASIQEPTKARSKQVVKPNIQLFPDLPSATKEAESTFETLKDCTYLNKSIGNSGQDEAMTCDCKH